MTETNPYLAPEAKPDSTSKDVNRANRLNQATRLVLAGLVATAAYIIAMIPSMWVVFITRPEPVDLGTLVFSCIYLGAVAAVYAIADLPVFVPMALLLAAFGRRRMIVDSAVSACLSAGIAAYVAMPKAFNPYRWEYVLPRAVSAAIAAAIAVFFAGRAPPSARDEAK